VDAIGRPHIAYSDLPNSDLKYAYKGVAGWQIEVVDSEGWVGHFPSLRIDESGRVHIGYYDDSDYDLRYAYQAPGSIDLSWNLAGTTLELTWTKTIASAYWVFGAPNVPHFSPGFAPGYQYRLAVLPPYTHTWSTTAGVSDPSENWTFLVMSVDQTDLEVARSNEWESSTRR